MWRSWPDRRSPRLEAAVRRGQKCGANGRAVAFQRHNWIGSKRAAPGFTDALTGANASRVAHARVAHRPPGHRMLSDQASGGLKSSAADTGALTLIQRFGSAANLNIHLHCLVLDGIYRRSASEPVFQEARAPTTARATGRTRKDHHAHDESAEHLCEPVS